MRVALHLIKGTERRTEEFRPEREERFRYPAHEEIWEVSCEPDLMEDPRPKLRQDRQRAS
jgi:hypothetical protein